jgi:hypothetical protein
VIWLSSASDHLKAKLGTFRLAEQTLATQQVWINAGPQIKEAAEAAVKNLDPAKTYNSTFLVSEILGIANRSGLTVNTDPPRTQRSPQFSVHTVQVTTRRAELTALIRFYQELASKAPYLGLEQVQIQGDRSNPGMVNATLQVGARGRCTQGEVGLPKQRIRPRWSGPPGPPRSGRVRKPVGRDCGMSSPRPPPTR